MQKGAVAPSISGITMREFLVPLVSMLALSIHSLCVMATGKGQKSAISF